MVLNFDFQLSEIIRRFEYLMARFVPFVGLEAALFADHRQSAHDKTIGLPALCGPVYYHFDQGLPIEIVALRSAVPEIHKADLMVLLPEIASIILGSTHGAFRTKSARTGFGLGELPRLFPDVHILPYLLGEARSSVESTDRSIGSELSLFSVLCNIHPFASGNKRVARARLQSGLLSAGLIRKPLFAIGPAYETLLRVIVDATDVAENEGDLEPLARALVKVCQMTLGYLETTLD